MSTGDEVIIEPKRVNRLIKTKTYTVSFFIILCMILTAVSFGVSWNGSVSGLFDGFIKSATSIVLISIIYKIVYTLLIKPNEDEVIDMYESEVIFSNYEEGEYYQEELGVDSIKKINGSFFIGERELKDIDVGVLEVLMNQAIEEEKYELASLIKKLIENNERF